MPTLQGSAQSDKVLAAYVPAWGVDSLAARDLPAGKLTHLIYAFAKPVYDSENDDASLTLDFPGNGLEGRVGAEVFERFLEMSSEVPGVKRMVSIGGWGLSGDFSDIANSAKARRGLAIAVVRFVDQYQLDGVDIDWEYPVEGGLRDQKYRPEDRENLVKLIGAIRNEWKSAGNDRDMILTVAVPGSYRALTTRYALPELARQIDWFNVMAYDYSGSWSPVTAHFAPLFAEGTPVSHQISAAGAVATLEDSGVGPEKIVLGLGLAGIRFEGVLSRNSRWIGASYVSTDEKGRADSWNDLRNLSPQVAFPSGSEDQWSLQWDDAAKASFWISEEKKSLISFESLRSAREKAEFVGKEGLRGMMIWSLEKDRDDWQLVSQVSGILQESTPPPKESEDATEKKISFDQLMRSLDFSGSEEKEEKESAPAQETNNAEADPPAQRENWRARP